MAINDVSLTSGMRANLLSLQGTVNLLDRTQGRLASGKKVNTAIDNPISFFASQALTSRAADIDSLKDAMGQAVQTITAADKGIKAITAMIEQAKGIAQAALSAEISTGFDTETVTLNSLAKGDNITIGGTTLTAGPTAVATSTSYDSFTMTLAGVDEGDSVVVGGVTFTATAGAPSTATEFNVSGGVDNVWDAGQLAGTLAMYFGTGFQIGGIGTDTVILSSNDLSLGANTVQAGSADLGEIAIAASTTVTTSEGPLGAAEFAVTGDNVIDAQALANKINSTTAITDLDYSATASNGVLTIANSAVSIGAGDVTVSSAVKMVEATVAATNELTTLVAQYNEVRNQIDGLAGDSGYKGKNLLSSDALLRSMAVAFEGITLNVTGFDATSAGLGINTADAGATQWSTGVGAIGASITQLDDALATVRQNSSALAGNLSIITVRQDFSTNMINTLTEGSDKLTLADANEEGANMLMLQTRQTLSTTALSLSAQAAQSVLRLFQ